MIAILQSTTSFVIPSSKSSFSTASWVTSKKHQILSDVDQQSIMNVAEFCLEREICDVEGKTEWISMMDEHRTHCTYFVIKKIFTLLFLLRINHNTFYII